MSKSSALVSRALTFLAPNPSFSSHDPAGKHSLCYRKMIDATGNWLPPETVAGADASLFIGKYLLAVHSGQ
jgi:hypothetical protein